MEILAEALQTIGFYHSVHEKTLELGAVMNKKKAEAASLLQIIK